MFIGHYALAPIAAATGQVKLWQAFVAVQFVDFIWAGFILTGVESARIVPGFTQASPFDLYHMPFTHSLLAAAIWALVAAIIFKAVTKAANWGGSLWIAALVFSHWLGDLLVHIPDLLIFPGADKVGFGLWKTVWISFPLELAITLGAMIYFIRKTASSSQRHKLWIGLFFAVLVILQVFSNFGPPPASIQEAAITALIAFSALAFLAGRFERTRRLRTAA